MTWAAMWLLPQRGNKQPSATTTPPHGSLLRVEGLSSATQLGRGMLAFVPTRITIMKVGDNSLIKLGFTCKNKDAVISNCKEWLLLVSMQL